MPRRAPYNELMQLRYGDMAHRLQYFKEQMTNSGIAPGSFTRADVQVDDLEAKLIELKSELSEMNENHEKLQRTYNELVEYKLVLQKCGGVFYLAQRSAAAQQRETESSHAEVSLETSLLLDEDISGDVSMTMQLGLLTGLVPRVKCMAFGRMLFRAIKGNVLVRQTTVENPVIDPAFGEKVEKNVFVISIPGRGQK